MSFLKAAQTFIGRFSRIASLVFVVLCALWSAQWLLVSLPDAVGRPFEQKPLSAFLMTAREPLPAESRNRKTDDDSVRISTGLSKKPTFGSTFDYWIGSWPGGDLGPSTPFGPYFRPLTSQLWWLERHFSGRNSLFVFLIVHLLFHIAFTISLWCCLRLWWNNEAALLCIWLWCVGAPAALNMYAAPYEALRMWKDDPELTVGLSILGAMMATRAFVLTSRSGWLAVAILAFVLSLAFKESGYVTPFFVALALWRFGATKRQWRVMPLFFGVAVLAFIYRTWALQGPGGHHGANGSWAMRAVNELGGGKISAAAWSGNSMALCVAALLLAPFHWSRSRRRVALIWMSVCVVAAAWSCWNSSEPGGALIQLCDFTLKNPVYSMVSGFLLSLALWQIFVLRRPSAMLWGYLWVVLAYLPLLKQAVTSHGFYFFSVGWAWWLAGAIVQLRDDKTFKTALHATFSRINPVIRRAKTSGATG